MVGRGRDQRGSGQLFQLAERDDRVPIPGSDDLALLREFQAAGDRSRRLGQDGPPGGPATAADGAASTVKEGQLHTVAPRRRGQRLLGAVQHPACRQEARLLVRIRVAEHDLLAVPAAGQMAPVSRVAEKPIEEPGGARQGVRRFEQRHHVQLRGAGRETGGRGRGVHRFARQTCELERRQDVRRVAREADDIPAAGLDAVAPLDVRHRPEGGQDLGRADAGHGRKLRRRVPTVLDRGQCRSVDVGMLADLERCEVEAERLDLPAKLGDLAPRDARQPLGNQRVG